MSHNVVLQVKIWSMRKRNIISHFFFKLSPNHLHQLTATPYPRLPQDRTLLHLANKANTMYLFKTESTCKLIVGSLVHNQILTNPLSLPTIPMFS